MTIEDNLQDKQNRRIAKNTIILYLRMVLSIIVRLYTSREILRTLGVEDYGIYGLVGGVVSMFSFLNAAMSGATSRFLAFELGKGNKKKLSETFSASMMVHLGIVVIILFCAETIGLYFLCYKLVIPSERIIAAHIVYQFSIISMIITVTQVPYNANIIAREKMDVYAYVELLNVFLKLLIVYLLLIINRDKLIVYSCLVLCVSIITGFTYRIYCLTHFKESHFHFIWNKELLLPMLNFSGWDLFGNMSVTVHYQGIAFLLNIFFGPILNAANSIALTVQGTIKGFAYNVIQVFRPVIIKEYARNDIINVTYHTTIATELTLALYYIMAIPLFINADFVLKLWLGNVPEYSAYFLRIILVSTIFNLITLINNISVHATARMKSFSIASGLCYLLSFPLMYILLKLNVGVKISYSVIIICYASGTFISLLFVKRNIPTFNIRGLLLKTYPKSCFMLLCAFVLSILINALFESEYVILLVDIIIVFAFILFFAFVFILDSKQRNILRNKICFIFKQS